MRRFLQEPVLAGLGTGLALAFAIAFVASDDDLKPDHFRSTIGVGWAFFFVPVFTVIFYAARSVSEDANKWAKLRVVWPIFAAWFTLGIGWTAFSDWNAVRRFDREGEQINGKVIDTYPHDHNTLAVRYVVAGRSYEQKVSAPGSADAFMPGDTVEVYYYTSAPGEGFCREPHWQPATLLIGWALSAGIGPALLAILGSHLASRA